MFFSFSLLKAEKKKINCKLTKTKYIYLVLGIVVIFMDEGLLGAILLKL